MERAPDGEFLEIMDTFYTRDMDIEWLGSEVWEEDIVPPSVEEAWNTQKFTFSPHPSVEKQWGTVESVYYPVVRDGRTIGMLGVDYGISHVNALQGRVLIFLVISFTASAVLTGMLALAGSHSVLISIEEREKTTREALEREAKIKKLMDTVKEASETRTAFLYNISNAMENPINNIIRLSSLLSKYTEISEEHHKNLDIINDEGLKLYNVINDILDILKIEAGKLKINFVKYKLPKFIYDITSPYSLLTEDKPIKYQLVIDDKMPVNLIGDELRIRQICHHLLTNAFKYTHEGSITVNITCKKKNEVLLLVIKITDTGIGIAESRLSNIFMTYGQGTGGLGLFICKQLAELMRGTLTVTSEHGKGSTFTLCIPQKLSSNETIEPDIIKKLTAFEDITTDNT
jgi:signal transduction histidine kinase